MAGNFRIFKHVISLLYVFGVLFILCLFIGCMSSLYKTKEYEHEQIEGKYYEIEMPIAQFRTFPFQDYEFSLKFIKFPSGSKEITSYVLNINYHGSFFRDIKGIKLKIDNDVITLLGNNHQDVTWYNAATESISVFLDRDIENSIKNCNTISMQIEGGDEDRIIKIPSEGIDKIKDFFNKYPRTY